MTASSLYKVGCTLGEGAMWHQARNSFFWVDIEEKKFYECHWTNRLLRTYEIDFRVSLVLETSNTEMVLLAVQGGLMRYDLNTCQREWATEIEADIPRNRTNDGACDNAGRIWIGTMNEECEEGQGSVYRVERNGKPMRMIGGVSIPNGIAWSDNGTTMYHVDSHDRVVRAYDFDPASGNIQFKNIAIQVPAHLGSPDGMCMDEEGMLWIAHWNGFGVYRWNPVTGILISKIEVPVPQVSSCAFGGDDMRSLLITTAKQGLSADQLRKYASSGDVFLALPGCRGVANFVAGGW
jgi:sugar lactone lactonase YvrE